MKDIKSYVIGFLTCACLFLIMGQTSHINNGRYQAFGWHGSDVFTLDTRTGEIFHAEYDTKKTLNNYSKIYSVKRLN